MIQEMLAELQRFGVAVALIIVVFMLIGRVCQRVFKIEPTSLGLTALDVFDGFVGNQNYSNYTFPLGKIYLTLLVYIS